MKKLSKKIVFISWAKNVARTKMLSNTLGAIETYIEYFKEMPLFLVPIRYLLQAIKTLSVLVCEKPDIILVQNPPIVAPFIVYCYSKLFRKKYIIDSHTGAFSGTWKKFEKLNKYFSKNALINIITNEELKNKVESWGAKAIILEDGLHDLVLDKEVGNFSRFSICVINSYSPDEPLEEIFQAADNIPECDFFVTGKISRADPNLIKLKPDNVILTDFLSRKKFIELLNKVEAIMVLTTRDLTLLEGGFEAVAAEKPLITSDWPVLKNYFRKGTLYVDNSAMSIEKAVLEIKSGNKELSEEIKVLKRQLKIDWDKKIIEFNSYIESTYQS
jgi:hypothetical protein